MTRFMTLMRLVRARLMPPLSKEQATLLASIKLPCC